VSSNVSNFKTVNAPLSKVAELARGYSGLIDAALRYGFLVLYPYN